MPENKEDATIQVIAERISSLHVDVTDLRNDMQERYKEMSEAIKSLIRLEEKLNTPAKAFIHHYRIGYGFIKLKIIL